MVSTHHDRRRKVERALRRPTGGRTTAAPAANPVPRRARRILAVAGGLAALGTVFYIGRGMHPAGHTVTNSPVADTRTVAPTSPTAWPSFTVAATTGAATAPGVRNVATGRVPGVTTAPAPTVTVTTTATATATATVTTTATVTVTASATAASSPSVVASTPATGGAGSTAASPSVSPTRPPA